eukprot:4670354-Prymnesium_polylepis.1
MLQLLRWNATCTDGRSLAGVEPFTGALETMARANCTLLRFNTLNQLAKSETGRASVGLRWREEPRARESPIFSSKQTSATSRRLNPGASCSTGNPCAAGFFCNFDHGNSGVCEDCSWCNGPAGCNHCGHTGTGQ